ADPAPPPHWCPGDFWDPGWGPTPINCRDDLNTLATPDPGVVPYLPGHHSGHPGGPGHPGSPDGPGGPGGPGGPDHPGGPGGPGGPDHPGGPGGPGGPRPGDAHRGSFHGP